MPIHPEFRITLVDRSKNIRKLLKAIKEETCLSREKIALYSLIRYAKELKSNNKKLIKEAKDYQDHLNFKDSLKMDTRETHQIYYIANIKRKVVNMMLKDIAEDNILRCIKTSHTTAKKINKDIYKHEAKAWKSILEITKEDLIKIKKVIRQYLSEGVHIKDIRTIVNYDIKQILVMRENKNKHITGDLPEHIEKSNKLLKEIGEYIPYTDDYQGKKIIKNLKLMKKNNLEKNKKIMDVKDEKNK